MSFEGDLTTWSERKFGGLLEMNELAVVSQADIQLNQLQEIFPITHENAVSRVYLERVNWNVGQATKLYANKTSPRSSQPSSVSLDEPASPYIQEGRQKSRRDCSTSKARARQDGRGDEQNMKKSPQRKGPQ
jgi:hypothetical protein